MDIEFHNNNMRIIPKIRTITIIRFTFSHHTMIFWNVQVHGLHSKELFLIINKGLNFTTHNFIPRSVLFLSFMNPYHEIQVICIIFNGSQKNY